MLKDIFVGGFGLTFMFNEDVIEGAQLLILFIYYKRKNITSNRFLMKKQVIFTNYHGYRLTLISLCTIRRGFICGETRQNCSKEAEVSQWNARKGRRW